MATIVFENGKKVKFEGNPTPEDIEEVASQFTSSIVPSSDMDKVSQGLGVPENKSGLFGTSIGEGTEALKTARTPAQMMRMTGKAMSDSFDPQTKSVALNAIGNLPGTVADIGATVASYSAEPENALMLGAAKLAPAVRAGGRWLGKTAEGLSGLNWRSSGVLARETASPGGAFRPGVDAANEIFAENVDPSKIRETFKMALGKKEMVEEGLKALKEGTITPDESLLARQAVDSIRKTLPNASYKYLRKLFDDIAKPVFKGADEAYKSGVDAESLRSPLPLNRNGTPSKLMTSVGAAGLTAAKMLNPYFLLSSAALSPAVQGGIATSIGLGRKAVGPILDNPASGATISALIDRFKKKGKR